VLGAALAAVDGATLAGATDGAVVAPEVHAERVMARTAIATAAVRNERMQELLHKTLEWFTDWDRPGGSSATPRRCSVSPSRAHGYHPAAQTIMTRGPEQPARRSRE
jgi:hypothetical protein